MEQESDQDPENDGPAGPQPPPDSSHPSSGSPGPDASSPGSAGAGADGGSGDGGDGESVFGPWDALEGTLGAAREREDLLAGFAPGGVWDQHPPGPELAAAVARAVGPGWRCSLATGPERIGLLRAMASLQSWSGAGVLGVIRALIRDDDPAFLGRSRHGDLPDEWDDSLVHEISLALAVSAPSAGKTTQAAWELGARLPGVEILLADGTLDLPRARLVAEVFGDLSDANAARAEELLIPRLTEPPRKTFTQVERLATAIAAEVDPDLAERRRRAAEKHLSRVIMFRERSGTAALSGRDLPADQTLAAFAHVNARAGVYKESGVFPEEGMDRLRAAAYLDILNDVSAEDRIAYGRLSPDDDAPNDNDNDNGDPEAEADGDDAPDTEAGLGGSDCPCGECDGRCAPPDDSDFPDDGFPDDGEPDDDEPGGFGSGGPRGGGGPPAPGGNAGPGTEGGSGSRRDGGRPPGGDGGPGRDNGRSPGVRGGPDPGRGPGDLHPGDTHPCEQTGADHRPESAPTPPRSPFLPPPDGPPPTLTDLVFPLATLLGLADRPGEGHGLGALDPALCRALAATAARSPHTTICVTVTNPDGIAIGHGCVTSGRLAGPPGGPPPPLVALPARMNLTITAGRLAELCVRPQTVLPGPPGGPAPPGARAPTGWALAPRDTPPTGGAARTRGPTVARKSQESPGDPEWCRPWALTLPSGLEFTLNLEPVPTFDCDHRNESHAYQPNATLRHLVQIRDYACTFPPCSRHARESDFEHAIPYDQGGRTCACNAGARSRKCHRIKQSPGWNVTQPKPGWHQWTTPRGRTYTPGPKRYPV
jgi:hypothetical protein